MGEQTTGYICVLIACLCFGTNYVPAKKVDIKDGQFFNFILTIGVGVVGLIQWLAMGRYKFEPLAMIGGATWAVANLCVPFIIKRCGLGIGQLCWCAVNMLVGWATGSFGLFGITRQVVAHPGLNYLGVAISLLALLIIPQLGKKAESKVDPKLLNVDTESQPAPAPAPAPASSSFVSQPPTPAPDTSRREFSAGLLAAAFAGVLMGCNFDVPTLLKQAGEAHGHSSNDLDYVLSHYMGATLFTSCFFCAYKLTAKECYIGKEVILPGLFAGVFWAIAQLCWFYANGALSFVVTFPIITGVPGVLSIICGMVFFGENTDSRSRKLLAVIIGLTAVSLGCIAVSHGPD